MAEIEAQPHLPRPAAIEAYGNGGFRFAGLSHRGSLLCLPDGIWAWPGSSPAELSETALKPLFTHAGDIDFVLIGSGRDLWIMPEHMRERFRALHISADVMPTGAAVRTYNVLLAEGRRVAGLFIAVD
jgi:uncharacterized protein